jgi:hypothetical protein
MLRKKNIEEREMTYSIASKGIEQLILKSHVKLSFQTSWK